MEPRAGSREKEIEERENNNIYIKFMPINIVGCMEK